MTLRRADPFWDWLKPKKEPMKEGEWVKSTRSAGNGQCVEVTLIGERVGVRHSKRPEGAVVYFSKEEWRAFLQGAQDGEFNV